MCDAPRRVHCCGALQPGHQLHLRRCHIPSWTHQLWRARGPRIPNAVVSSLPALPDAALRGLLAVEYLSFIVIGLSGEGPQQCRHQQPGALSCPEREACRCQVSLVRVCLAGGAVGVHHKGHQAASTRRQLPDGHRDRSGDGDHHGRGMRAGSASCNVNSADGRRPCRCGACPCAASSALGCARVFFCHRTRHYL